MAKFETHPGIEAAIRYFGSQRKLALALRGWSQQTISRVLNGKNRVSAEMAIDIEKATRGVVPRWTLRPDIFEAVPTITHLATQHEHASAA